MDGCGEHDGLLAGGLIIGSSDIRQVTNREIRLNSAFPNVVQTAAEFRPLGFDCSCEDFLGTSVVVAGVRRLHDLASEGNKIGKVTIKTFVSEHPADTMESPGEQPLLFLTLDESATGIALAWIPEGQPNGRDTQSVAKGLEHGSVWFALTALVFNDGALLPLN